MALGTSKSLKWSWLAGPSGLAEARAHPQAPTLVVLRGLLGGPGLQAGLL
jgi:hypothetical protein